MIFATQSLADIQTSSIAPTLIESCPTRIFLPNPMAIEETVGKFYQSFGLNKRQLQLIAEITPKRDYYFQSPLGNRIFDLGLGEIALAFCGASSPEDQKAISEK